MPEKVRKFYDKLMDKISKIAENWALNTLHTPSSIKRGSKFQQALIRSLFISIKND